MEGSAGAAVARAKAGDRDAFREIVEAHSRAIFRLAYRVTGNEEDAEDVVQETFLKAYGALSKFEGTSEVATWLHRIAANCAIDSLRRRRARSGSPHDIGPEPETLPDEAADPEAEAFGSELDRRVRASMSRLSAMERAAFTLRHFEGRSIAEIGRMLGLRTNATKNCVFRAVAKLREDLAPLRSVRP
jgi:RNA polymerase sigma-70 factor (ECF subfamily)